MRSKIQRRGLNIAVIGFGTAGGAAAAFLARDGGHNVTIFDKTSTESLEKSNAGAGLGIQPIGLRVLQRLNVLDEVLKYGSRIDHLKAVDVSWNDRTVLDLSYRDFQESLFGLGLHRSVLFHSLRRLVENESKINIQCGVEVVDINIPNTLSADPDRVDETLVVLDDNTKHAFDLVVVADGRRSIRTSLPSDFKSYEHWYKFGCLWTVLPDTERVFSSRPELSQKLEGTQKMLGFLPSGRSHPDSSSSSSSIDLVSLFWSLDMKTLNEVQAQGIESWKSEVLRMEPRASSLLEHVHSFEDLIPAEYSDTFCPKLYYGNSCVFLGDCAHAMSPQLGQGANLALVDAWKMSSFVNNNSDGSISESLRKYDRDRRWRLRFYQLNSRMLTPVFQSHSKFVSTVRNVFMGPLCKFPPTRWQMLATLCGAQNNGIPYACIPEDEYMLVS